MSRYLAILTCLAALAACGKVASPDAGADTTARACPAGTTTVCTADSLVTCDADGNQLSATPCMLGCNSAAARCNKVDPANGLAAFLDEAELAPELTLVGAATIDTDAGTITDTTG